MKPLLTLLSLLAVGPFAGAGFAARSQTMNLDLLRLEGPENIHAFLRVNREKHSVAARLVTWNFASGRSQSRGLSSARSGFGCPHPGNSPRSRSLDMATSGGVGRSGAWLGKTVNAWSK